MIMRKIIFSFLTLIFILNLTACGVTDLNNTPKNTPSSNSETKIETTEEKYYLTGAELERIDNMFEGNWQGYVGGNLTEYVFANGKFEAYVEIGGQVLSNYGTYKLTNVDMELYYQNGTTKNIEYSVEGDEVIWDLPQ